MSSKSAIVQSLLKSMSVLTGSGDFVKVAPQSKANKPKRQTPVKPVMKPLTSAEKIAEALGKMYKKVKTEEKDILEREADLEKRKKLARAIPAIVIPAPPRRGRPPKPKPPVMVEVEEKEERKEPPPKSTGKVDIEKLMKMPIKQQGRMMESMEKVYHRYVGRDTSRGKVVPSKGKYVKQRRSSSLGPMPPYSEIPKDITQSEFAKWRKQWNEERLAREEQQGTGLRVVYGMSGLGTTVKPYPPKINLSTSLYDSGLRVSAPVSYKH